MTMELAKHLYVAHAVFVSRKNVGMLFNIWLSFLLAQREQALSTKLWLQTLHHSE